MGRPRLTIGSFGDITTRILPSGRFEARTRYRDWDGRSRIVQATADTAKAAERALKEKLAGRSELQPASSSGHLTPDSPFGDLVAYWLQDLDLEGRISKTTRLLYERNMRTLVLPVFEHLTLREIGVARCDRFIKEQARISYNRAKQSRVVLRLALELAVRHEVLPANPMHHVSRVHREGRMPDALTSVEVNAIRAVIARWESGVDHLSGPRPDGQLGAIVEVMLGTSARIGEVLEAVRRRLALADDADPESLVFCSREGTPLTTANVRRQLRHVLERAGIGGVTPHLFRRTVATAVNDNASVELAAELLGHTDTKITVQHYIQRSGAREPGYGRVVGDCVQAGRRLIDMPGKD